MVVGSFVTENRYGIPTLPKYKSNHVASPGRLQGMQRASSVRLSVSFVMSAALKHLLSND